MTYTSTDATLVDDLRDQPQCYLPLPHDVKVGQKFASLTVAGRVNNDRSGRIRIF